MLKELLPSLKAHLYSLGRVELGSWWNYENVNSPFTRVIYVTDGEVEITIGEMRYKLAAGNMVLVPPFVPANYYCPERADHYYIIFRAELAHGLELFSLPNIARNMVPVEDRDWCFRRLLEVNPDIALESFDPNDLSYNEKIWQSEVSRERMSSAVLLETEGLLRVLLAAFLNPAQQNVMKDSSVDRLVKILAYIENNLSRPITLEDMAREVSLHPTYFSDLFAKQMGERPISYLTRARIGKAQILLATTDKPIKNIAWDLGFKDANYFYRVFKKRLRLSPGEWRRHFARHNQSQNT